MTAAWKFVLYNAHECITCFLLILVNVHVSVCVYLTDVEHCFWLSEQSLFICCVPCNSSLNMEVLIWLSAHNIPVIRFLSILKMISCLLQYPVTLANPGSSICC